MNIVGYELWQAQAVRGMEMGVGGEEEDEEGTEGGGEGGEEEVDEEGEKGGGGGGTSANVVLHMRDGETELATKAEGREGNPQPSTLDPRPSSLIPHPDPRPSSFLS